MVCPTGFPAAILRLWGRRAVKFNSPAWQPVCLKVSFQTKRRAVTLAGHGTDLLRQPAGALQMGCIREETLRLGFRRETQGGRRKWEEKMSRMKAWVSLPVSYRIK